MILLCEVIRDLLPLYYDKVCSEESCALVEEHLDECAECTAELKKLKVNFERPKILDDEINTMKNIAKKWKKDKKSSFAKGSMLVSALAAIICLVAYNVIGAEVLPDGTLVEPFALIPIGYIFALIFIISLICNFVFSKQKYKMNTK